MADRPPAPSRRPGSTLAEIISLPALLAIVVALAIVVVLALLPGVVWQLNPRLWRQMLRVQGGAVGLVIGLGLGYGAGRLTARRRRT